MRSTKVLASVLILLTLFRSTLPAWAVSDVLVPRFADADLTQFMAQRPSVWGQVWGPLRLTPLAHGYSAESYRNQWLRDPAAQQRGLEFLQAHHGSLLEKVRIQYGVERAMTLGRIVLYDAFGRPIPATAPDAGTLREELIRSVVPELVDVIDHMQRPLENKTPEELRADFARVFKKKSRASFDLDVGTLELTVKLKTASGHTVSGKYSLASILAALWLFICGLVSPGLRAPGTPTVRSPQEITAQIEASVTTLDKIHALESGVTELETVVYSVVEWGSSSKPTLRKGIAPSGLAGDSWRQSIDALNKAVTSAPPGLKVSIDPDEIRMGLLRRRVDRLRVAIEVATKATE